jgi:multicomponent Na+:H+ antiporter subunit D
MDTVLLLPVLIPFVTAIFLLLARKWRRVQRLGSVAGAMLLFGASIALFATVSEHGVIATQPGNWPAPFGITIVADLFSAIMVLVNGLMGTVVAVYSLANIDADREHFGYHPLYHMLLMGVSGAFLTGDMFNLYVWFEVMLISSFVLITLGGQRGQLEGAIKYVTLNLVSSSFFLASVGILYGLAGTLNMADLARTLPLVENTGLVSVIAMLFLVAFGIKAAIFPLFFWLPASYHTPPVAVSAIFASLLTKVGVYALIRVFTLLFSGDIGYTHTIILVIAGFTMVTGVLGAAAQTEFRRLLSFHIVSQIGYMIMGLGLFTHIAIAAAIYYVVHNIVVKTALFLVSGIVQRLKGTLQLKSIGGLYKASPLLATLFIIPAFSLAGVPPLSGFWGKLSLIQAGLAIDQYAIVAAALGVSLLTLFSMTKLWGEAFWKPHAEVEGPDAELSGRDRLALFLPVAVLVSITVILGLFVEPFFGIALRAADQLLNPTEYINAVLKVQQ